MNGAPTVTDSTRRALRTAYQVLLVALTLAAVLVAFVEPIRELWPQAAGWVVGLATAAGIATRLLTAFEDQFPAAAIWLRDPDTYKLPDSTRRAIRTGIATLVGALAFVAGLSPFVPFIAAARPDWGPIIVSVVAGAGLLSKIVNALEDAAGKPIPVLSGPAKRELSGKHETGD